jgi:hypothetical protein
MVITISAYTEPIPPPGPQINETPIVDEGEENEEKQEFAEILAGLLRKDETEVRPDLAPVPLDDGTSALAEFFGAEDAESGLLAGIGETGFPEEELSVLEIPQDENFQAELSGEYEEVLISAERLLNNPEPELSEDFDVLKSEKFAGKFENHLTETEPQRELSSLSQEAGKIDPAVETYASVKTAEDSSFSRTENKKDKVHFKDENIQPGAKEKKAEDVFFANKKNDAPGRLDEMRSRLRKDKINFEVRDMRTGTESAGTRSYSVVETSVGRAGSEAPVREITLELRLPDNPLQTQSSPQTTWEVKAGNALENMLARELHQNFNGDIVRHASMALRDGGEGTIRIALKPESLGNVKIRLEMAENKITGHIVVESEEALNAFRKEISSLEQAFRDTGFADASLNLSLTADGAGTQEQEEPSFAPQMAASLYGDSAGHEALSVDVFFGRSGSINILA